MFFLRNFKNIFKNFKYMLIKKGVTSNGSKYSFRFKRKLPIKLIFKKLFVKIKNSAGRTSSGRISVFSKGKRSFKKRSPSINYSFRLRFIGFVGNIIILPYTHRLVSMFFLSTGGITYIPTAHNHTLFKLVRMYRSEKNLQQLFNKLILFNKLYFIERGFFLIKHLPKNQRVSLLEPLPGVGVKYVRSPASKAVITKFDRKLNTALVKLPSGVRKVFSQYSLGSVNSNPFLENKYWKCNKAGYYRNFGKKSIVRGVAMNPVDHPHGGRAKSVNYQRTPWGKTTKYK